MTIGMIQQRMNKVVGKRKKSQWNLVPEEVCMWGGLLHEWGDWLPPRWTDVIVRGSPSPRLIAES